MHASLSRDELEIWLEIRDPDEWEQNTAAWDYAQWDGPIPANAWSSAAAGYVDVTCDVRGWVLERGRQSNWDDILAAHVEIEIDNSSGRYSVFGSEAWPRIRPGFALKIDAKHEHGDGRQWPLFVGNVTEYIEAHNPGDTTIRLKAVDAFRWLNDPIGVEYNPGSDAQLAGWRIDGLLDRVSIPQPRAIQFGTATMTNYKSSRTILDEIQVTAMSDGGIFFIDNDGTITYLDRTRFHGRSRPPGLGIPSFTDACDSAALPYAAIDPIIADQEFGNVIVISNVSQGTDSPFSAIAVDQESIDQNGYYRWSPEQLVICNANHVQGLANFQLERRSTAFYRINSFECYPAHDDRLWDVLLPMRVGDSLFVERTPPYSQTIYAPMLCDGIRIEATPELWKWTIRCSPGDSIDIANFWDFDGWDESVWV